MSIPGIKKLELDFDLLKYKVCETTGMPINSINLKSRITEVVETRQLCHYFAKKYELGSLSEIGYNLGKKSHSTVLHSIKTISNLLECDKRIYSLVNRINENL